VYVLTCQAKGQHEGGGGNVDADAHYVNGHLWLRQTPRQQNDGLKAPPLHTNHGLHMIMTAESSGLVYKDTKWKHALQHKTTLHDCQGCW